MSADAICLLGFAIADPLDGWTTPGVISGTTTQIVRIGTVALITTPINIESWTTTAELLTETDRLRLVEWAVRYDQIVQEIHERTTFFPLRLGTFFSSEQVLSARFVPQREWLEQQLTLAINQDEWTVKAFGDDTKIVEVVRQVDPELREAGARLDDRPGTRYLQQKRVDGLTARKVSQYQHIWMQEWQTALELGMIERQRLPITSETLDGGRMLWQEAFRIERTRLNSWITQVDHLAALQKERGITMVSSGPWPLYHFTPVLEETGG